MATNRTSPSRPQGRSDAERMAALEERFSKIEAALARLLAIEEMLAEVAELRARAVRVESDLAGHLAVCPAAGGAA